MEPGLVKHGVFEVDGVSVATELHKVTNCSDTQFQLPLGALDHRAAGLRICLNHLHANIYMYAELEFLSGNSLFVIFFTPQTTCLPYPSHAAVVNPPWRTSATALSSVGHPSQPPALVAAETPPDKPCISLAHWTESQADQNKR